MDLEEHGNRALHETGRGWSRVEWGPGLVRLFLAELMQRHMRHILIIDDDRDARDLLAALVSAEGFQVAVAGDGREALDYLRALKALRSTVLPCLILLDLAMPTMDGLKFRMQQKRDPTLADIPVIAVTARVDAGRRLGVPLLSKPVDPEDLLRHVKHYCGRPDA